MAMNEKRRQSGGQQIICLSVSSVGPTKIFNMSNNAGRLSNTSFVGCSCMETEFVGFNWSSNGYWEGGGALYNGTTKDIGRPYS